MSNGATLNAGSLYVGVFGNGTFNQTGGTVGVPSGFLAIGQPQPGSTGAYNFSGGTLNAADVLVQPNGTFSQTGGSLFATTFELTGGWVTGTLQNRQAFTYSSGTFVGRMINDGTVTFADSFTIGNGLQNDATFSVSGTQTLNLNGLGLDNLGNNNQPLTNANLIAGNGVLRTGGLLNSGTVVLSDLASQV